MNHSDLYHYILLRCPTLKSGKLLRRTTVNTHRSSSIMFWQLPRPKHILRVWSPYRIQSHGPPEPQGSGCEKGSTLSRFVGYPPRSRRERDRHLWQVNAVLRCRHRQLFVRARPRAPQLSPSSPMRLPRWATAGMPSSPVKTVQRIRQNCIFLKVLPNIVLSYKGAAARSRPFVCISLYF